MKGAKKNKVKLTAFLCCSAAGEKLPPLLIGTAKKPRCFGKAFHSESAGFIWHSNKTGWIKLDGQARYFGSGSQISTIVSLRKTGMF